MCTSQSTFLQELSYFRRVCTYVRIIFLLLCANLNDRPVNKTCLGINHNNIKVVHTY
jgi:hypothetical protein